MTGALLSLDTTSPVVSVAAATDLTLAERSFPQQRSSALLLTGIGEVLEEVGSRPAELTGIVALRGPGSFTGLRVGLATALGLHQATGAPATAIPTLEVLAAAAGEALGAGLRVAALVDALRDEWFTQRFVTGEPPAALGDATAVPTPALAALGAEYLIGWGTARLAAEPMTVAAGRVLDPPPLAAVALRLARRCSIPWEAGSLCEPLYLRRPAVTPQPPTPRA